MAHQFVSEVLLETEQSPHGPAFKKVCARFHIDSRAVGTPLNGATEAKTVDRIQKLLALAKSPNEHEAQVALNKARRLMAEHANAWEKREHAPNFQFRQVGPAKGRFDPWEKCLAGLLARHFFVLAIWVPVYNVLRGKTVRILEINGRCDALEVAEYAHAFLTHTAETLWKNHRQAKGLQSNKDRRTFLLGVMMGFTQSLEAEEVRCEEAGLVPRQDDELDHWFRKRHRHIRTRRGGTIRQTEALQAGQAVGRNIQLRQALTKRRGLLRRLLG